jgi:glycosyltransferase involved in cell wall biosynthesis
VNSKKNKIWVVSELFYPETISTAYIMTEIAVSLSEIYNIEVICGSSFYESNKLYLNNNQIQFRINRVKSIQYDKNNIIKRLFGNFNISWKIFLMMKKKIPRNSQILMVSNPIFLIWLSSLLAPQRKWKIKLIVHDVFPENLQGISSINNLTKIFLPVLKRIFDLAFSKMDTLILLGRDMKDIFSKKVNDVKIKIIENWSENELIHPKNNFEEICVFIYAGNLGRVQGIETLLESLSLIRRDGYKFLFIGSGACKNLIYNYIKNTENDLVQIFPWQQREKQNEFLNKATVGVVTLAKGMYGLGVPSKFYNLLAAGKPILYIGPKNSEIWLVVMENKLGWVAEAGNVLEIKDTIEKIITTESHIIQEYSSNSRKLAEIKYSKKIILQKYNNLFSCENID